MSIDLEKAKFRTVTIGATAGNVTTYLQPTTLTTVSKRWLILRGRLTLTTDGTVVNRTINLTPFSTGLAQPMEFIGNSGVIPASTTKSLSFGEGANSVGGTLGSGDDYIGLHRPIIIVNNNSLQIAIVNGVAGDSYSGYIEVLEL